MSIFNYYSEKCVSNVNQLKQRNLKVNEYEAWLSNPESNWYNLIQIEKQTELEAWCEEFYFDHLPSNGPLKVSRKWSWITYHLSKYFKYDTSQWNQLLFTSTTGSKGNNFLSPWLDNQSLNVQFKLYWPYLKCVDRTFKFKRDRRPISTLSDLERTQYDNYEKPNHYLKLYLKSNPFTCLLYKQYKEYTVRLRSHRNIKWKEYDSKIFSFYQSLLASLLVSIVRITFLEFERSVITSLIVNLDPGHQTMHLFYKNLIENHLVEKKLDFYHLDWNMIHSLISLILDSRSYNPTMQLEQICKRQLANLPKQEQEQEEQEQSNILAMEFDFEQYQLSVWNTNKTVIKWQWIDWHFKNVQWLVPLLSSK